MKIRYFNHGTSYTAEHDDYQSVDGDFITDHMLTDDELAAAFPQRANMVKQALMTVLQTQRNDKLTACDWTQLADCALTADQKAAWAVYRTALRNLPANTVDPANPIWPTEPT